MAASLYTKSERTLELARRVRRTLWSAVILADGLARHERAHLKQIERTLNALEQT
jgi:hypothetical protein